MVRIVLRALALAVLVTTGATALCQSITTSALRGRVTNDGQGLPGVSVEVASPALQGTRTAFTSTNGDYVFAALPPGGYTVTFKLQGFETLTRQANLSTAQQATVDAVMNVAGVAAAATVVATAETVSTTTQASTTITSDVTQKLPVARTIISAVDLSSGISRTGPAGNVTISGAQSFDNVFTVDGAVIQDNLRSTPYNLFIEDAVQETTTSVSAVSAEFGRFTGGVVNTVTKSGGNVFSGSFRSTLTNDAWSAITPGNEKRVQKVNPRYEATLGGFVLKDHIWFFGSGRFEKTTGSAQTGFTNVSFETGNDEKRYQGKLTVTPFQNHSVTGTYMKVDTTQSGYVFPDAAHVMDLDSVVTRDLPQDILTVNYNGVLSSSFFVEALYSSRHFTFENAGSLYTDLIKGTLMRDESRGNARYNSPTFCGVCDPEKRDNRDYLVKGTWFLSTGSLGSHNVVFGYDNFAGQRKANNYQSGSNYRLFTTSAILQGGDIFPVIDSSSYVYYTPIERLSQGTDTLTHSLFVNDAWRVNDRLSVNLGLRWDKNDAKDSRGVTTADDSAFSPRLAASYDVTGKGNLKVAASYARYIGGIQDNLVDSASNAGSPGVLYWFYGGPEINVNPAAGQPLTTRAEALQTVFDWFFAQGCPNLTTCKLPLAYAFVPGLSSQIRDTIKSPYADELTFGVSGNVGNSLAYRVDLVRRKFGDFYNTVRNTSTGQVDDGFGNYFDVGIVGNTNGLERNYTALQAQLSYRMPGLNVGANWTWSHTLGNFDGETSNSGPVSAAVDSYPEYKAFAQYNPSGSLATDQRHRVRIWAAWDVPFLPRSAGALSLSLVQGFETGTPYGAVGAVRSKAYVPDLGYATPPSSVTYYYTARDAYRTDDISRTDLGLNYSFRIADTVELFLQPQVVNAFNNQGVVTVDTTVRSRATSAAYKDFNPFTEAPVQGVNWDYGPSFGKARSANDYQQPRTFLMSLGLRF